MHTVDEPTPGPRLPSAASRGSLAVFAALACMPAAWAAPSGLDTPITASWHGIGPRVFADRIAAVIARPVVVDRRLDPERLIDLDCRAEPAIDTLRRGADQAGGELAALGSAVLLVPPGSAGPIERADIVRADQIARLPARQRGVLAAQRPWSWPAGSTPVVLVADAAREADIPLDGLEAVPHDHLPAASLPSLTRSERLAVLLAQYDLRIDWQAADAADPAAKPRGRIVPIDAELPGDVSPRVTARGPHASDPRRPRRDAPKAPATYSLEVAAPLDQLLAVVARRLELELELDREALSRRGVAPQEIVRTSVRDASRETLLDAILRPLGLDWSIEGRTLQVR